MNPISGNPFVDPPIETDSQKRKVLRWLLRVLIVSSVVGIVSLATDVVRISYRGGSSGDGVTITHHTLATGAFLSALVIFQSALAFGLARRLHAAWRGAFSLPMLWASLGFLVVWSPRYASPPHWSIPFIFFAILGVWQSFAWRRRWIPCEVLFV